MLGPDNAWVESPDGKSSLDKNRLDARNIAEILNTATHVNYGTPIDHEEVDITPLPIPDGQPVMISEHKLPDNLGFAYWFEAVIALDVACAEEVAPGLFGPVVQQRPIGAGGALGGGGVPPR